MKIIILAGGVGSRLWPSSRQAKPKQFQELVGKETMLERVVGELLPRFKYRDIFVSTNDSYIGEVRRLLPRMPRENIIGEPEGRGTASSIALGAALIHHLHPGEAMAVLPSDHFIKEKGRLAEILAKADKFLKNNPRSLVTLGIKPRYPETGYGYIKKGGALDGGFYKVAKFTEKPDLERARKFLGEKKYFWNSGIFVWQPAAIIGEFKKYIPDTYRRIKNIEIALKNLPRKKSQFVLRKEFRGMDNTTIDYGIMENTGRAAVLPVNITWSDVGDWAGLKNLLVGKGKSLVRAKHLGIDSSDLLVYSLNGNRLITTIGVSNLIIVDTKDAILISDKNRAQEVKEIVAKLKKEKRFKKHL